MRLFYVNFTIKNQITNKNLNHIYYPGTQKCVYVQNTGKQRWDFANNEHLDFLAIFIRFWLERKREREKRTLEGFMNNNV